MSTFFNVRMRVYAHKLVIMNEGILPEDINIEDLKHNHLSKPLTYLHIAPIHSCSPNLNTYLLCSREICNFG